MREFWDSAFASLGPLVAAFGILVALISYVVGIDYLRLKVKDAFDLALASASGSEGMPFWRYWAFSANLTVLEYLLMVGVGCFFASVAFLFLQMGLSSLVPWCFISFACGWLLAALVVGCWLSFLRARAYRRICRGQFW